MNTPLKIAVLTSSLDTTNGWGRYSVNLIKSLQSQGAVCSVYTEDKARPEGLGADVTRLRSSPGSGLLNGLKVIVDVIRLRNALSSADVIHAFTETNVFLAWLSGRPFVVSTHGTYTLRFFKRPLLRIIAKRAFEGAFMVIITSAFTLERIKEYVTLRKTVLLPNGVDTSTFKELGIVKKNPHSFITVGAIKARKGQDIGILALRKLVSRFPDAKYVIVGRVDVPDFYERLLALIKEHGLEQHVVFEQNATDARLVELYNESAAFVLPSIVDKTDSFEGYPLSLLEASACGIPILGGRGCGAEHLIEEGKSGYLVTPSDVDGLVESLSILFSDPEQTRIMGARAKEIAQGLSWNKNAEYVMNIYRSL